MGILTEIVLRVKDYALGQYPKLIAMVVVLVVGYIIIKLVDKALTRFFNKTKFDRTLEIFAQRSIKVFLWLVLLIVILGNLGFNTTGFVAGLGIVGFIVGNATRDVLSNLAAGVFLLVNRPFRVGDTVVVAGVTGVVKEINLAACVIHTEEEVVIVPNSKVWGAPIKNKSREIGGKPEKKTKRKKRGKK